MQAFAVVAHPDDCLIFAKCFIDNYNHFDWNIIYLTYNKNDDRAIEVANYWNSRSIKTLFLGFKDHYIDLNTQKLNYWTKEEVREKLLDNLKTADLIITHNSKGEYGHIHHIVVNEILNEITIPKIFFSLDESFTKEYQAIDEIILDNFPLHKEVLNGFDLNVSKYTITKEAYEIIKNENINIR